MELGCIQAVSNLGKRLIWLCFALFMLYDRPYMRHSHEPESTPASAYMILLCITVGVFVLQQLLNVFFPGNSPYTQ